MVHSSDDELVPLDAAVAVVYFHLTGSGLPDTKAQGRDEVMRLTAIALAQVAEIRVRDDLPADFGLQRCFVRRGDLRVASATLAGIWSDVAPVRPSLSPS